MSDWFKDPGQRSMVETLFAISGLIGKQPEPVKMWVTSTVWAALALEAGEAPGKHPMPLPGAFEALTFGNLLVVNSGTEDEEHCHRLNAPGAEKAGFAWKRENWRTG